MRKAFTPGLIVLMTIAGPALAAQGAHGLIGKGPETRAEMAAQVKVQFDRFDTNKDGAITRAEFESATGGLAARRPAAREPSHADRFAMLDTDRNGQISRAEWDAGAPPADSHGGMNAVGGPGDRWFDRMDANKDGKVTLAEAQAAAVKRFDRLDTNKDGTISPEERKAARAAKRAKLDQKG
jgi:hypothetical protein